MGEDLRTPARLVLSDPEGPLALLAVDDPSFWKGLQPLPLAEAVPAEGEVKVYRWLRSGQFDSSRATLRQVRGNRHGLSRTTLLTLEASSSLDGAGDSEVLVKDGAVRGPRHLQAGRDPSRHRVAGAAPVPGRRGKPDLPRLRPRGHRLAGPDEPGPARGPRPPRGRRPGCG